MTKEPEVHLVRKGSSMIYQDEQDWAISLKEDGFSSIQISYILDGFREGLDYSAVKIFAKKELSQEQMRLISYELKSVWNYHSWQDKYEQVEYFAKPEYSHSCLSIIYKQLKDNVNFEKVKFYATPDRAAKQLVKMGKLAKKYRNLENFKAQLALVILENS